jgi:tetratricopeptide (TPR) repeat protein
LADLDTMRKATELLQKGRYDDALAEYRAILESSRKKNPALLNLIGDIHTKQGTFDKAFEHYLEACRLYAEEGLFHNGIAVGKKILRMDREQVEVYGILGSLYARQGLGGDCVKFLREYARRKDEAGEYPAALAAFAEACEVLRSFPEVHVEYAEMLERVARGDDAAAHYLEAARIWADRGLTDRAMECQKRAVAASGKDPTESAAPNMTEIMSLRTLEDSPTSRVVPKGRSDSGDRFWGRVAPPGGLDIDTPIAPGNLAVPWARYDAAAHPGLPPPPPLPPRRGRRPAALPVPPAAPPVPSPGQGGVPDFFVREPAGLDDGLTLDLEAQAPPAPGPTFAAPPVAEAAPELSGLPGIVMPPPDARPRPPSSAAVPTAADAELAAFFEATAGEPAPEQAVVIGDDLGLIEGGDVSEVIADFRAATMEILDLDDHQAHYDLGTTFMEMELFEEAAAEFEIASRGADFALPSQEMLGYCFLRKGQIELAIRELEKGLALPDRDERAKLGLLYNLGIACSVLDREEEAILHFRRILEVEPDFRDTQIRLERLVQSAS